jgi:hypothetical protein
MSAPAFGVQISEFVGEAIVWHAAELKFGEKKYSPDGASTVLGKGVPISETPGWLGYKQVTTITTTIYLDSTWFPTPAARACIALNDAFAEDRAKAQARTLPAEVPERMCPESA